MSAWVNLPPEPPTRDWLKAVVYMTIVGICIGFWIGVVFTILAAVR